MPSNRTIRKPVPQISTCLKCGQDFSYMRTLMEKKYCEDCYTMRKQKEYQERKKSLAGEP